MVTEEILKAYLEDMTKKDIQLNSLTFCEEELIEPEQKNKKYIEFYHNIFNKYTGITKTNIYNQSDDYEYEDENPSTENKKIILIKHFNPLKEFPNINSRGILDFGEIKKNDFRLGTLFNAQLISNIRKTYEFEKYYIKTNTQTPAGRAFWNSIGINSNDLMMKGIPISTYYNKSLEAAIKAGYKF